MKLTELKGIGPKTESLFAKLGINSCEELMRYYPVHYEAYLPPVSIGELKDGSYAAVQLPIINAVNLFSSNRKLTIVSTSVKDITGTLRLSWYNMPYVKSRLNRGDIYVFHGLVRKTPRGLSMEHPKIFTPAQYEEKLRTLTPVYGLTKGLSNNTFVKAMTEAFEKVTGEAEYLPTSILNYHQLMGEREAMHKIHFPVSMEDMTKARSRLAFDEFFLFILSLKLMKRHEENTLTPVPFKASWETENVISRLPYRLTNAQLRTWHEIEKDLSGKGVMHRLIQGDVGSGKTIIAFLAMVMAADSLCQSALMAPTEVLARQHFRHLEEMIEEGQITNIRPVLLVGSLKKKEKEEAYRRLQDGTANAVIGTHAIIQEGVHFKNLALVITDEQHRFGVNQRELISEKGTSPHRLVMSATPIPRTLGVVIYGDMAVSILDEMPKARQPIKTCVVDTSFRPKAYQFIDKEVTDGHQVYIICPLVEETEGLSCENVKDYQKKMQQTFPDYKIGLMHGRMKGSEKDKVMQEFSEGKIQLLVSTTVVEVGVDVPNATVILIENAERYGLAALHQLRGRVGRGQAQSFCIFMTGTDDDAVRERLDILNKSRDGLEIARHDLALRGPGDLLGLRQSGEALFTIADVYRDEKMLEAAGETAASVIADDPALIREEHEDLRKRIKDYLRDDNNHLVL